MPTNRDALILHASCSHPCRNCWTRPSRRPADDGQQFPTYALDPVVYSRVYNSPGAGGCVT
jgi:hypothetical protein